MDRLDGMLIDTDVLVVGAGAGGLIAALSAKRNGPPGTRVTLVDSWLIGRTGHTAFSNAWTIVALPGDDIDGILHEIVAGNDGIADQVLVRQALVDSHGAAARTSRRWACTSAATRPAPTSAGRRAASISPA